jgi:hypothetical protein
MKLPVLVARFRQGCVKSHVFAEGQAEQVYSPKEKLPDDVEEADRPFFGIAVPQAFRSVNGLHLWR